MRQRVLGRRIATTLAVSSAALVLATSSVMAGTTATEFTGGGRGPTADTAIQSATWDAEASAASENLYNCTMIGEPSIFETLDDPNFGHVFRAEVTLSCTP